MEDDGMNRMNRKCAHISIDAHTLTHTHAYRSKCKYWHKHKREHQPFTRTFITYVDCTRTHTHTNPIGIRICKGTKDTKAKQSRAKHSSVNAYNSMQSAEHIYQHTQAHNVHTHADMFVQRVQRVGRRSLAMCIQHETENGKINVKQIKAKESSVQLRCYRQSMAKAIFVEIKVHRNSICMHVSE